LTAELGDGAARRQHELAAHFLVGQQPSDQQFDVSLGHSRLLA
jgi:hypothetical protein